MENKEDNKNTEKNDKQENENLDIMGEKKEKVSINNEKSEDSYKNGILEDRDDNESDNNVSLRYGYGNDSFRISNKNILNITMEGDISQITGRDETQNSIVNKNEIYEYKMDPKSQEDEEEKKIGEEEEDDINVKNYLGNLFRNVVNKKNENPEQRLQKRLSIFSSRIDDNQKDVNFGEIINAQLYQIKDNTLTYFDKIIKEFSKRYDEYVNNINDYINQNEFKFSKVFKKEIEHDDNLLEFAENNIFDQFDAILEVHENIMDAIKDHIKLLGTFLQTDLIQQKNPLEYFINNNSHEILNCWFLNKINFEKVNFTTVILNKDLSELCSRYLSKKKDNNFSSITLKRDNNGSLPTESNFIRENIDNLRKIKFINIKCDEINSMFDDSELIPSAKNLRSLNIFKSDFSSVNLIKINTPELKKLKVKKTPLPLNKQMFLEALIDKTLFLQCLNLQNCFLDDRALDQIFSFLAEKAQIIDSLQQMTFSGNEITVVNMGVLDNNDCTFKSLRYLDLSKNNIYEFKSDNYKFLPEIKFLDLTDNNISTFQFFDFIKSQKEDIQSIALLNNNFFISNNVKNANSYRSYFNKKINKFAYKLKKLNLSFLYDKESMFQLVNLRLSPMVKISLIKLNLSYNGLTNKNVYDFFKNNYGLMNLETLNLSNNFLDSKIFSVLIKLDLTFEHLKCLDLSMNDLDPITIEEYKNIGKFSDKHLNLKRIKLQETYFCQNLLLLLDNPESQSINENLIKKELKFVVENENNVMIEPLKELFELKDKDF